MASYKVYVCIDAPHLRLATLGAPSVQVSLKRDATYHFVYIDAGPVIYIDDRVGTSSLGMRIVMGCAHGPFGAMRRAAPSFGAAEGCLYVAQSVALR